MNQYITGSLIKELREKRKLTQADLANELNVSDKTISKWETGQGYPDITILDSLAKSLNVSIPELLTGNKVENTNRISKMSNSKIYVCPICSNVIHSIGETYISCHGIKLNEEIAEKEDFNHQIKIEKIEDEYFVSIDHEMSKTHYISFIAASGIDTFTICKLYPESNAEARFKISGTKRIYFFCNRDGLFYKDVNPKAFI